MLRTPTDPPSRMGPRRPLRLCACSPQLDPLAHKFVDHWQRQGPFLIARRICCERAHTRASSPRTCLITPLFFTEAERVPRGIEEHNEGTVLTRLMTVPRCPGSFSEGCGLCNRIDVEVEVGLLGDRPVRPLRSLVIFDLLASQRESAVLSLGRQHVNPAGIFLRGAFLPPEQHGIEVSQRLRIRAVEGEHMLLGANRSAVHARQSRAAESTAKDFHRPSPPRHARGVTVVAPRGGGDQALSVAVVDQEEPPLRLPLGRDTYQDVRASLVDRLAEHDAHRERALAIVQDEYLDS